MDTDLKATLTRRIGPWSLVVTVAADLALTCASCCTEKKSC